MMSTSFSPPPLVITKIIVSPEPSPWTHTLLADPCQIDPILNHVYAVAAKGPHAAPPHPREISLLLTDDETIRFYNAQYRDKDTPTNVLSFEVSPDAPPEQRILLGDIILSYDRILAESSETQTPLRDHAVHLLIHGFLHLLGYTHHTEKTAKIMEKMESQCLRALGLKDPWALCNEGCVQS